MEIIYLLNIGEFQILLKMKKKSIL